jgi:hypothetical protein
MKKLLLILLNLVAILSFGQRQEDIIIEATIVEKSSNVPFPPSYLGYEFLKSDDHLVSANQPVSIVAPQGTRIVFAKNSFVNDKGEQIESNIKISVIESIDPADIVLSSLYTVTDENQLLQTKGMVEIRATSEGEEVYLAKDKSIEVTMPVGFEEGYQYYEGEVVGEELNWTNPTPIVRQDDALLRRLITMRRGGCGNRSYVMYPKVEFKMKDSLLNEVTVYFIKGSEKFYRDTYNEKQGRKAGLTKDQSSIVKAWFRRNQVYAKQLAPRGEFDKNADKLKMLIDTEKARLLYGRELTFVDPDVLNVFEMKKLGWANIDRLAKFPNAEKMKLEVEQKVIAKIDSFNLMLVVPSANVFIPGRLNSKGNYAFSSGDANDGLLMPPNEKAYLVAIGTKNGQKYFDLKEIRLGAIEVETLQLMPTKHLEIVNRVKSAF